MHFWFFFIPRTFFIKTVHTKTNLKGSAILFTLISQHSKMQNSRILNFKGILVIRRYNFIEIIWDKSETLSRYTVLVQIIHVKIQFIINILKEKSVFLWIRKYCPKFLILISVCKNIYFFSLVIIYWLQIFER